MKKNMLYAVLLSLPCLASCARNDGVTPYGEDVNGGDIPRTRGFLELTVVEDQEGPDKDDTDRIKSVRVFVFKNADRYPIFESADYHEVNPDIDPSVFRTELEVIKSDKLVVVIVNEPTIMMDRLRAVRTVRDLEEVQLEMAEVTTGVYDPGVRMPMSGAVWIPADAIKETREEIKSAEYIPYELTVERVLARVDVKLGTDIPGGVDLLPGTKISLRNSYDKTPLVHNEYENYLGETEKIGSIQTVSPDNFITPREWLGGTGTQVLEKEPEETATPICSFFTPERYCLTDTDKLEVDLNLVLAEDDVRTVTVKLDEIIKKGESELTSMDTVLRNNRYVVFVKICKENTRSVGEGIEVTTRIEEY